MKHNDYWAEVALEREQEAHTAAEEQLKNMLAMYDEALDDIKGEIGRVKYNYAKRFGYMDDEDAGMTKAETHLAREIRNYNNEKLTQQLLEAGSAEERKAILDFIHRDGLSTRAYASRIERYKAVQAAIELRMLVLEYSVRKAGEVIWKNTYKDNYYRVLDDTAKGMNAGISFSLIDDKAVEAVMSKPWHGKRFSQRIWDNTSRLANEAQEIVGRYLVSGRSLDKAVKELANSFEVEKFHATTLIHTETAHARALSDAQAYRDIGIEDYRYLATLDEVTCDICGGLDGKCFKVSDIKEGENFPVMHPRCRCTSCVAETFGSGRRARNPLTGRNKVIDDMSYDEWQQNMSPEEKQAFAAAQRSYRNKAADKRQHEQYRKILGKDVPRSLDKFQELKYNNTNAEMWRFVKLDYKRQNALVEHPELSLPNAKTATADDRKFTHYLFSETNKKGQAKGRAFTSRLGYDINNYPELKQEILTRAAKYPAKLKGNNEHGDLYEQKIVLYGNKGKPANVILGWINSDTSTRMTSAYIKEVK
ncbi:MAG: minor capsid protein [Oscillospiraceae bacterium]|nr:minor capsid protein [Oscillospiraceae bacterium]